MNWTFVYLPGSVQGDFGVVFSPAVGEDESFGICVVCELRRFSGGRGAAILRVAGKLGHQHRFGDEQIGVSCQWHEISGGAGIGGVGDDTGGAFEAHGPTGDEVDGRREPDRDVRDCEHLSGIVFRDGADVGEEAVGLVFTTECRQNAVQPLAAARREVERDRFWQRHRMVEPAPPERDQIEDMIDMHVRDDDRVDTFEAGVAPQFGERAGTEIEHDLGIPEPNQITGAALTGVGRG